MKLADIKVGEEYGALANLSKYSDVLPRRVKVLEIVKMASVRRSGGGFGPTTTVQAKKIKVEALGIPSVESHLRHRSDITTAPEGEVTILESKNIVAPWSDLAETVGKKLDLRARTQQKREEIQGRFDVLLGEDSPYIHARPVHGLDEINLSTNLQSPEVERLLEMAEKGASCE